MLIHQDVSVLRIVMSEGFGGQGRVWEHDRGPGNRRCYRLFELRKKLLAASSAVGGSGRYAALSHELSMRLGKTPYSARWD